MQLECIVEVLVLLGSVCGFGVCDALCFELFLEQFLQLIEDVEVLCCLFEQVVLLDEIVYELHFVELLQDQLFVEDMLQLFIFIGLVYFICEVVLLSVRGVVVVLVEVFVDGSLW